MNKRNDAELAAAAKAGDRNAFSILVHRYQNDIYNLSLHLLDIPEEAEDVAAEAFVRAWKGIKGFRNEAGFRTWVWRIASNLARSRLRRRYVARRVFFWQAQDQMEESSLPDEEWKDEASGSDPEKCLEQKNIRAVIQDARKTLSPREQQVFTLKYDENMKITEIADALVLSENTVKVLLFRASRKLAAALKALKDHR